MPGGFIEALEMGEKAGAQMPMLIMLQFLRLILCIVLIPLAFASPSTRRWAAARAWSGRGPTCR
jgi:uncharacterized membrane protein AbrB (regulator of aidB expression)